MFRLVYLAWACMAGLVSSQIPGTMYMREVQLDTLNIRARVLSFMLQ